MTIQQSIQVRDRDCAKQIVGDSHQVNCKGDKIENIAQLLMHLGMDDIKDKCDDCDIEVRNACLAKQSQTELVKRAKIATERMVTEKKIAEKRIAEKADTDSQCVETHLLSNRLLNGKERSIENKLILSSIFASMFVVAMRF
ncbi:hypothetical protein [Moritella sp. Urea-trap-13]|uniref:hypothetical protein n=1 Tax=Moritella sp. Urea-trap-13 TaxID=2058327 RepID=UPI000C34591B|nr:hypothetical protein [Moritella sp. Urea-trap-13]PKH07060.1 hypothetical protein CXF93_14395 [Moritella sp. Urea-trap-13]